MNRESDNGKKPLAILRILWNHFGFDNVPEICGMDMLGQNMLLINSAEILEEFYIRLNKFTNKSISTQIAFRKFIETSTLVLPSDENWSKKRKSVSSAFYKEKLIQMTEKVKDALQRKLDEWELNYLKQDKEFDLVSEMNNL